MEIKRTADISNGGAANTYNKHWKPIHTSIVLDSCSGKSISQLSEKYGFAESTLANMLRTKKAKEIRAGIERNILAQGVDALPEAIKQAKILAFHRVQTFLQNDDLAEKSPFAFFDKSIKALEVLDKIENPIQTPSSPGTVINAQMNIFESPEKMNELTAGLNKALEVSQQYSMLTSGSVDGSSVEFVSPSRSRENQEGNE